MKSENIASVRDIGSASGSTARQWVQEWEHRNAESDRNKR